MKIKEILSNNRNDFTANIVCSHCNNIEFLSRGYDDDYYHSMVIPRIFCSSCGKNEILFQCLTIQKNIDDLKNSLSNISFDKQSSKYKSIVGYVIELEKLIKNLL